MNDNSRQKLQTVKEVWERSVASHYLKSENEEFHRDMETLDAHLIAGDRSAAMAIAETWRGWAVAQTYITDRIGAGLACGDLEKALTNLKELLSHG